MARTDLLGKVADQRRPDRQQDRSRRRAGSVVRKVVAKAAGVSPTRLLPPYAKQRFSTWFKKRPQDRLDQAPGQGHRVPDLPRRVPGDRDRQGPRQGLRTQRHRVLDHRGAAVAARRGCTPATSSSSPRSPRRTSRPSPPRSAAAATSSCRSRRAATCSRRTTSTTSAGPTPNSSPSTPTTPPST